MTKISFYLMNFKGYYVLSNFIENFGSESIKYVVSSRDKNVTNDYYDEIKLLSDNRGIRFYNKSDGFIECDTDFNGYKFAIGWRWIIKDEGKLIVFHDSLLPKYRGFSPLVNCMINGDQMGGVTALFANSEYDRGEVIAQKSFNISYPIKLKDVINKVSPIYFDLVSKIYILIDKEEEIESVKQDESKATYSPWLDDEDYYVDWTWSANKLKKFVDAVGYPYDYARAYLNGKTVKLINVSVADDVVVEHRMRSLGKVLFSHGGVPSVVCGIGMLSLDEVRDECGNTIDVDFRSRFK